MSVVKGDDCQLLDNTQKLKWRVKTSRGQEGMIPAVCFVVPAPDEDAQRSVADLRAQLDSLRRTWTERQRALRFKMIFSTIGVVRSWDLQQVRQAHSQRVLGL